MFGNAQGMANMARHLPLGQGHLCFPQLSNDLLPRITYVSRCESLFPWADFMLGKSAVKLHFLLDADAGTPQDLQVTSGQVHELEVARKLSFAPGDLLLLDRGYVDLAGSIPCANKGRAFHPAAEKRALPGGAKEPRSC